MNLTMVPTPRARPACCPSKRPPVAERKRLRAALGRLGLVAALGLLSLLGGCAQGPGIAPMPSLDGLEPVSAQTQRLTFVHQGERRELIGVLRHDHRQLQLALLSLQGQRLLTLTQDAEGARFAPGAVFTPPFSADWLASRLSFSLWPEQRLHEAFAGSDWSLVQQDNARSIYFRNQLVVGVKMTPACHVIHDIEANYWLSVSRLGSSPAPATRTPDTTINHRAATDLPCPST
ncbi:MAG: DUF3261 domain-containing protein [Pseudomonadota bacterium]|nr:DUF3261 domain-containing protein [Pseudomonadota bacterium]